MQAQAPGNLSSGPGVSASMETAELVGVAQASSHPTETGATHFVPIQTWASRQYSHVTDTATLTEIMAK